MLFKKMITAVNANEKTERDSARSIFKNEVELIINRKALVLKLMIIK